MEVIGIEGEAVSSYGYVLLGGVIGGEGGIKVFEVLMEGEVVFARSHGGDVCLHEFDLGIVCECCHEVRRV